MIGRAKALPLFWPAQGLPLTMAIVGVYARIEPMEQKLVLLVGYGSLFPAVVKDPDI
jgi:hypothetical protein